MAMLRPATEMKDSGIELFGAIPVNWIINKLNRICDVVTDFVASGSFATLAKNVTYLDTPDYAMLVRTTDVSGKNTSNKRVYVSKESYDFLHNSNLFGGELILPNIGAVGDVYMVPKLYDHMTLAPNAIMLKTNQVDRYYYYFFQCDAGRNLLTDIAQGTVQCKFNKTELKQLRLLQPPLAEQQVIADYLDDRCSKIDEIIAEATASIEEYKELKQAVIFEAVTKGLDKKSSYNKSLDWCNSGICNDWDISQIRYLYRLRNERNEKPLEEVNLISLYTDKGVVQHADLEKTTGNKAVTADGYKMVYPEDIIVNIILCWMGAMGRCEYEGVTSPAYDIYEPIDRQRVSSRYYHYLFRTERFAGKCYTLGRGIMMMRWRTYSSEFRSIKVPVPSYSEQIAIADFLDKRIGDMDALISEKQALIDDLQAYKKSLIYEVVTGKRRVV